MTVKYARQNMKSPKRSKPKIQGKVNNKRGGNCTIVIC